MPSKKPANNPEPAAKTATARPEIAPVTTSLTHSDIDQAREDALLQLSIGRTAHYYSVVVSAALLFDALLVLFFSPNLLTSKIRDLNSLYFLLVPLVGGLYLAVFGLRVKWEAFQFWPWEAHFSLTVAAVAIDALMVVVYAATVAGVGPTHTWSLLPWFYPLSLAGISLPLIALALTWTEWSGRKAVSVGAALVPLPLALVLYLPSLNASSAVFVLALSLAAASVLYQMSGSFLHLIASGTRTHEREVITSGQSRLAQVAEDLKNREAGLRFREATLIGREADVENAEISLQRKLTALEDVRTHASTLEAEVQTRSHTLQRLQRELAVKLAETNSRARVLEDRESAIVLREKDLQARLPTLSKREQELMRRDGERTQREAELAQRTKELERKTSESTELDARLNARRLEIDRKTAELLQREGAGGTVPSGTGVPVSGATPANDSAERESRLLQLKETLDQQNQLLGQKAIELKTRTQELQQAREEVGRGTEDLRTREAEVARREAEATERSSFAEGRIKRYEETLPQFEQKVQAVDAKAAILLERDEEANRREAEIRDRERALQEQAARVDRARTELERRERDVSVKEKEVGSLEDELKYRRQELARRGPQLGGDFSIAFAAMGAPEVPSPPSLGPRRPRSGSSPTAPAVPQDQEVEHLQPPSGQRFPDRASTGTSRLDDLLMGGIPPHGHVMLIGDAFVGKEIAMYAFLAEGLKRGDATIVITAARGPDELAQRIGLVTPQFQEYEQLGMVHWVDASVPEGSPGIRTSGPTRLVTNGAQDHAGILSALVKSMDSLEIAETRTIRVGFFGLSATLAHADERERVQFIQGIVGALKPRNALALYALESGTLPETQMETVLSRMDGAVYFKREGGKTYLSVQGVGEVETREWVEYRATNRALVIGSFSLERIK